MRLQRCWCRLGRLGATELWLDPTWLVLLPALSWALAVDYFPTNYPVFSAVLDWGLGLASAALLLLSVVLHELGHLALARAVGLPRCRLLVFAFGAVAERSSERAGLEALVALAGPLASLLLAALAFWGALNIGLFSRPLEALLGYLGSLNLVLALVQLVPGWPLDGGWVLRWALLRLGLPDRVAVRLVAVLGWLIGLSLLGAGAWQLRLRSLLLGAWLVLLGLLLLGARLACRTARG